MGFLCSEPRRKREERGKEPGGSDGERNPDVLGADRSRGACYFPWGEATTWFGGFSFMLQRLCSPS